MNQIYKKKSFVIFRSGDGYIIHNTKKPFEKGHTHIKNINTAKYLVNLSLRKELPKRFSDYLLVSLIRLTSDAVFVSRIQEKRMQQRKDGKKVTIEVDCRKYVNCTMEECKIFGKNADEAVKKCADEGFKNYLKEEKK